MTFHDPNTLSNHNSIRTVNTSLHVALDFEKQLVSGAVTLLMEAVDEGVKEIVLDTSYLDIRKVIVDGAESKWKLEERKEPYGSALKIDAVHGVEKGKKVEIKVEYSTTEQCTALQWMTPKQTTNGKAPYMFSQCQAIHARSLLPCQDTPAVKSPFTMSIRSKYPVLATGLPTGSKAFDGRTETLEYTFQQDIPLPSYLLALASGDIAAAAIGPRSMVYSGPEELLKCKTELEDDVEKFIRIAENIVFPYPWTTYNVLILPASFPYGGMENPNITFATPTIISGDKSNIDVIAHELAHSWSGNLVSNSSWEHFWLNEGWTTYLERRIQGARHGEPHFHFSAIIGWKALKESVALYGDDHKFTKLIVDLEGEDPDDAFSSIPYEKGFNFLFHLDNLLGRPNWDKFIPHYFRKFEKKSLTSFDFKDTLTDFFKDDAEASKKLQELDWDMWFYSPGMPPMPDFDTSLADVCYALADKWSLLSTSPDAAKFTPSPSDIDGWDSGQKVVFLEKITDFSEPLSPKHSQLMQKTYNFLASPNTEILSRYLTVGLKAKDKDVYQSTVEFLGRVGRLKYVRSLYRLLNACDRELAIRTYREKEAWYHPICREAVRKDLKL
ncbi:leukotriene A-4 hydrol [Ascodesmis nigricans]|uniref:Leukotriene A(4) hydrolase n=1 Tax=Ascodesmis nigricans TaxID=341454 RepID=A0A4S2N3X9_9PEZI|nr:leukotriene A-4 hydrol [Ascodesmis nigricans]